MEDHIWWHRFAASDIQPPAPKGIEASGGVHAQRVGWRPVRFRAPPPRWSLRLHLQVDAHLGRCRSIEDRAAIDREAQRRFLAMATRDPAQLEEPVDQAPRVLLVPVAQGTEECQLADPCFA